MPLLQHLKRSGWQNRSIYNKGWADELLNSVLFEKRLRSSTLLKIKFKKIVYLEVCTVQESFKRKQQTCFQSFLLSISQEITKKKARGITITNTLYFDLIEFPFATRYFQEFSYIHLPQFRILKCCPLRHIWSNACNFSVSGKLIHNKQAVSTKLDNSTTAAHLSLEVDQNKSINKSINSRLFPIFENYPSSKKLLWNITVNSLLRLLPLRNFLCHQNY